MMKTIKSYGAQALLGLIFLLSGCFTPSNPTLASPTAQLSEAPRELVTASLTIRPSPTYPPRPTLTPKSISTPTETPIPTSTVDPLVSAGETVVATHNHKADKDAYRPRLMPSPVLQAPSYYNEIYRLDIPIPSDWSMSDVSTTHQVVLRKENIRLTLTLRGLGAAYIDQPPVWPEGELISPFDFPASKLVGTLAFRQDLMVEGLRKGVRFRSFDSESELLTDHFGLSAVLDKVSENGEDIDLLDSEIDEATRILENLWVRERYMAQSTPLEPVVEGELWSTEQFISPNGRWMVTNRSYQPYVIEALANENGYGPEVHRQTLTVEAVDGTLLWEAIDLIEGWGLGVGAYEPLAWTEEFLYFTYLPVPDGGCSGGVTGVDLWSLDLNSGLVERLADRRNIFIDFDPLSGRLAYPARSGVGLILEDVFARSTTLYPLPYTQFNWTGIAWSPSGDRLALVQEKEPCGFVGQEVYLISFEEMSSIKMVYDSEYRLYFGMAWESDNQLELSLGDAYDVIETILVDLDDE